MNRKSILRAIPCDLKKLPIGALEAFVLSQVHGDAIAEDVAHATGLEVELLLKMARHLFELGALSVDGEKHRTKQPTVSPPSSNSLVPPKTVPRARPHVDLRKLGLGPREGFVLSQIDGATSVADLGEITGLSAQDLGASLRALEEAGAVDLGPRKRRSSTAIPKAPAVPKPSRAPAPAPASAPTVSRSTPGDGDACDLPDAERARITETVARLETTDLYGVLGVERDADGKAIRRAYHALAGQFHPDRFFGKRLGPFKRPLERIFVRLTLAHDTLSKPKSRVQYDATLPPAPPRRPVTEKPPSTKRSASLAPKSTRRPPTVKPPSVKPPSVRRPPTVKPPPVAPPKSMERVSPVVSSVVERKVQPPPLPRAGAFKDGRTPLEHAEVFMRAGQEALDRDDLNAAAHHYRLALQCHEDPRLRAALTDIEARARTRREKGRRA